MKCKFLIILFILLTLNLVSIQANPSIQRFEENINFTESYFTSSSNAISIDLEKAKNLVLIKEQIGNAGSQKLMMNANAKQALDKVERLLKAAGCGWEDVVFIEMCLRESTDWDKIRETYRERFSDGKFPILQIKQYQGSPIQISCMAVVPKT